MTNPIQFDPATVQRLAALEIGEQTELRIPLDPQPAKGVEVHMTPGNFSPDGGRYYHNAMEVGRGYATQFWSAPALPGDEGRVSGVYTIVIDTTVEQVDGSVWLITVERLATVQERG